MNLILFEERQDAYTLPAGDPRFEHVRGVLRMREGDRFIVGVVNGPRGDATVQNIRADELSFSVAWDPAPMPAPPAIHLLLAVPRPATARKVLFDATTLGVQSFHFFEADKGDPAYAKASLWTEQKWREHLIKGAEQAFNTHLPALTLSPHLDAALAQIPQVDHRFALDVYEGEARFSSTPVQAPLLLAIGGERGWSPRERKALLAAHFKLFHLGARVLRVETALTTALALTLAKVGVL